MRILWNKLVQFYTFACAQFCMELSPICKRGRDYALRLGYQWKINNDTCSLSNCQYNRQVSRSTYSMNPTDIALFQHQCNCHAHPRLPWCYRDVSYAPEEMLRLLFDTIPRGPRHSTTKFQYILHTQHIRDVLKVIFNGRFSDYFLNVLRSVSVTIVRGINVFL